MVSLTKVPAPSFEYEALLRLSFPTFLEELRRVILKVVQVRVQKIVEKFTDPAAASPI